MCTDYIYIYKHMDYYHLWFILMASPRTLHPGDAAFRRLAGRLGGAFRKTSGPEAAKNWMSWTHIYLGIVWK